MVSRALSQSTIPCDCSTPFIYCLTGGSRTPSEADGPRRSTSDDWIWVTWRLAYRWVWPYYSSTKTNHARRRLTMWIQMWTSLVEACSSSAWNLPRFKYRHARWSQGRSASLLQDTPRNFYPQQTAPPTSKSCLVAGGRSGEAFPCALTLTPISTVLYTFDLSGSYVRRPLSDYLRMSPSIFSCRTSDRRHRSKSHSTGGW